MASLPVILTRIVQVMTRIAKILDDFDLKALWLDMWLHKFGSGTSLTRPL